MKKSGFRRSLPHTLSLGLLGCALAGCATTLAGQQQPEARPKNQPNILYIISDDLNTALSGYGHPQCMTPNLDRLAAQGVVFERAYSQYPVCGPARASIMTGQYPAAIGSTSNAALGFREHVPNILTFPQYLMDHGYTSARVSKIFHMGVPGEIAAGRSRHDDGSSWNHIVNVKAPELDTPGEKEDLAPILTHPGMDFITIKTEDDDSIHADAIAAREALRFMDQLPEPFFLGVGFVRPHVPLVAPQEYFDMYPWEEMDIPPLMENHNADVPEAALTQLNDVKYGMNEEQKKKALAGYYASITYMDHQVGRLLDGLEEKGLADNTIVVFTSDHGYNMGEHDTWQKLSLWEETTRVPLIISTPQTANSAVAGSRTREVVELIDLYPTFADLTGLPIPDGLAGESLRPMLENPNKAKTANPVAYTITHLGGESIRTERWRYVVWEGSEEIEGGIQLYDHFFDPGEFINLAVREGYEDVLAEMEALLEETRQRAAPLY